MIVYFFGRHNIWPEKFINSFCCVVFFFLALEKKLDGCNYAIAAIERYYTYFAYKIVYDYTILPPPRPPQLGKLAKKLQISCVCIPIQFLRLDLKYMLKNIHKLSEKVPVKYYIVYSYSYLQLFCREIIEFLLYSQGQGSVGQGNQRWKIFNFPKKFLYTILSSIWGLM